MYTYCATAAPTRHPPGEAHSPSAPAPLVTTFVTGPLPVNRASEATSRRLAAHPIGTRRPLSSLLSLRSTPQLQPAQPLRDCVAKNASGDTRRHATESSRLCSMPLPIRSARVAQVGVLAYLGGAAARGPFAGGPVTSSPVAAPVVPHTVNGDAPTPTRPTTSALCRPKRIKRHQASHDTIRAPSQVCRRQRQLSPGASPRTSKPQTTCDLCRLERLSRQQPASSIQHRRATT
jgi:hypothetical protein